MEKQRNRGKKKIVEFKPTIIIVDPRTKNTMKNCKKSYLEYCKNLLKLNLKTQ